MLANTMNPGGCGCSGSGTPSGVGLPGCYCQGTPYTLDLTVAFGDGETGATYGGAYRNSTLAYYTTPPPYFAGGSGFSGAGYYSTAAWLDSYGSLTYFRLACFSAQYALGLGQYSGGIWQAPGRVYTWSLGGTPALNTCAPFGLYVGNTQPGVYFNGSFTITG